ncbi:MAG: hypothetical protein LBP89_01400 [Helicobacteraceae bacterium]|jgi:tetratricopeptide (TPR) repeat protein|nr:hypothetical protein [Helicobacteraceae bacterium]
MSQENESKRRWSVWKLNLYAIGAACFVALCLFCYYVFSPSHGAAREARALYNQGKFDEALTKAQAIYLDNPYNVLAYSVVEQSKKAVRWRRFISDCEGYSRRIRLIEAQKEIDPADMILTKMMLETAFHDYERLGEASVMWDQNLVKEADEYYREFAIIYKRFFNGADR